VTVTGIEAVRADPEIVELAAIYAVAVG